MRANFLKKNLLLIVISIFISMMSMELILRFGWQNPYANSSADNVLKLRMSHKNIYQVLSRDLIDRKCPLVTYRTDSKHYIEPSFRFANPDFTIAFMGGSTTECIAVKEEKRFPFIVSKNLEVKGLRVNTLNAGRSGGTIHDSINILFNHMILDHPNVIILMHAVNDIGVLRKESDYRSRMGFDISYADIAKYSLQKLSLHSSLFGLLRVKAVASPGFLPKDPRNRYPIKEKIDARPFVARLKIFIAMCRAFDITPVLVTEPLAITVRNDLTPEWADNNLNNLFNRLIQEVSENDHVDLIDLSGFISQGNPNIEELEKIFYDGLHVTDYGSTLYASYISENLYKILTRERPKQ
jgi:GDSL-like Lipase/Acylhydrolase family